MQVGVPDLREACRFLMRYVKASATKIVIIAIVNSVAIFFSFFQQRANLQIRSLLKMQFRNEMRNCDK